MNRLLQRPRRLTRIERQAMRWVRRISAGPMTHRDGDALRQWCRANPAHAAAFATAQRQWQLLAQGGEALLAEKPLASRPEIQASPVQWQRRAFLGGAVGAVAATTAAMIYPPLGLWPSAREMRADYRTVAGEQRHLALGDDVGVELNTRTSIALRQRGRVAGIDLIAGETAIDMADARLPFAVSAGAGRAVGARARFEVRHVAGQVCVTCVQGLVQVAHPSGSVTLTARQQVSYDDRKLARVVNLDAARMPAWREGFLRFAETPLGDVVNEINRYRTGKLVLMASQLATRPVTGRFQLDALDKAIAQIQHSFGLSARHLPGGVVLLS
ncbi:FecR family protein [Cupriavidus sp. 2TAF22]|uniref:FecR family protein n=1 Tax=unclassified Cupriavidus TaxID=2640874 RepID=UPI003F934775